MISELNIMYPKFTATYGAGSLSNQTLAYLEAPVDLNKLGKVGLRVLF